MAEKGVETKLDTSVLNAEQQEKLRQFKIKTRIDNEKYIRTHPEVEVLVGDFLREILLKRPVDIREFAGGKSCTRTHAHAHTHTHTHMHACFCFLSRGQFNLF
uniref:RIIa domain-containing protein n=1 Tax=Oryzias latipes TaxID=8090 RepID=A0A3P9JID0_ORYLA